MDASIRKHMLEYFEGCKEEFGLIDSSELIKLCPIISPQEHRNHDGLNKESIAANTHGDHINKSNKAVMKSDDKVDIELLTYLRTIFLQVNLPNHSSRI